MTDRFSPSDLQLIRDSKEVAIETRAAAGAPLHRAVIWVVVDDADRVLVRTWKGPNSRWYREALAEPDTRLHVADRVLDVRAVPADDAERVEAYNAEVQRKYARSKSTPFMLEPHVLPTTLELVPR